MSKATVTHSVGADPARRAPRLIVADHGPRPAGTDLQDFRFE